jgi:hypothetical protein
MTDVQIPGIKADEFEATATIDGPALVMKLSGNADLRVNAPIGPFLDAVDDQARRNRTGEVIADFRELAFMNSSCLKEFVRWIAHVDERPEHHYRIRFLSDPATPWQWRSLQALRAFAPDLVTIEIAAA